MYISGRILRWYREWNESSFIYVGTETKQGATEAREYVRCNARRALVPNGGSFRMV
jgi:hypothetical protein